VLSRVPVAPDPLSVLERSGITTWPVAPGTPPDKEGLQCRHVSRGSSPPPSARGLWRCHMPPGPPPDREGLRCRHVSHGSRLTSQCERALASSRAPYHQPPTRQGRAPVSPCVLRLQTHLPVRESSGVVTCPMALSL
jgi:hypothetical protein